MEFVCPKAGKAVRRLETGSAQNLAATVCCSSLIVGLMLCGCLEKRRLNTGTPKLLPNKSLADVSSAKYDCDTDSDTTINIRENVITVFNHSGTLYASPDVAPVSQHASRSLACGALEILETKNVKGRLWYHVRQRVEEEEIVGWTMDEVGYSWGKNICPNRVRAIYWSDKQNKAPLPLPTGFVKASWDEGVAAVKHLEQLRYVYTLELSGCEKWDLKNGLMRRETIEWWEIPDAPPRRIVKVWGYGIELKDVDIQLKGPVTSLLEDGKEIGGGGYGRILQYQAVGHNAHEIRVIRTVSHASAYHPKDVTTFYVDEQSCRQAWTRNPRLKIDDPSFKEVEDGLRLFTASTRD